MAVINGTPSDDLLFGTDSEDQITALEGNDTVYGLAGNDFIQGNAGDDVLLGNAGDDIIHGGAGNDILYGGKGNDTLFGDKGDDTLIGNRGADYLQGGEGKDLFVIGAGSGGGSFQDADIISDFSNGEDLIGLTGGLTFKDLNITQSAVNNNFYTIIQNNFTGEYLAILQGVDRSTIGPGNFTAFEPVANPALPTVTITATDPSAAERLAAFVVGIDTGTFTVTRSNTVGNLTINYAISGTALNGSDYNNIATAVTIPDGQTSATITISPIDDGLVEPNETVVLGITPSAAYNVGIPSNATVTISDIGVSTPSSGGGTPPSGGSSGGGGTGGATPNNDFLTGTPNADNINGLAGNDTILGLAGDDTLTGAEGNDSLIGGEGNDILIGGAGADILTGGNGNDQFRYTNISDSTLSSLDVITDYRLAGLDTINLNGIPAVAGTAIASATQTAITAAPTFTAALDLVAANNTISNGISIFTYNSNTFVYREATGATATYIATDLVIQLTGLPTIAFADLG